MDNLLSLNSKQGGNYWESVCSFVNFDAPKKEKAKSKSEPQRTSTLLNDTKSGKHTDLARMRQVRRHLMFHSAAFSDFHDLLQD